MFMFLFPISRSCMREVIIPLSLNCLISTHSNNGFIFVNGGLVQFNQCYCYQTQQVCFTLNVVDKKSEIKTSATYCGISTNEEQIHSMQLQFKRGKSIQIFIYKS